MKTSLNFLSLDEIENEKEPLKEDIVEKVLQDPATSKKSPYGKLHWLLL